MCNASQTVRALVDAAGLPLTAEEVTALAESYDALRRSVDALYAVTTGDDDAVLMPVADPLHPAAEGA